jgi:tetratricopeptide repeat protein 21B
LESYYLLATKQRSNITKAVNGFKAIYDNDPDYLPGVLGLATAYMMEKDEHKAHNLLKRVAKMDMSEDDGEDFDRANLLLAKSYVDKSKYNLAQEICQRCLAHNRSSAQTWEILGLIYEKSSDYEHASECYEKAWKLEFELSAAVGFKLAFSYLKSQRYIDCIDVCETVLTQYPDYPRIREEILKKACQDIRTQSK